MCEDFMDYLHRKQTRKLTNCIIFFFYIPWELKNRLEYNIISDRIRPKLRGVVSEPAFQGAQGRGLG